MKAEREKLRVVPHYQRTNAVGLLMLLGINTILAFLPSVGISLLKECNRTFMKTVQVKLFLHELKRFFFFGFKK
jgi:hypothetical protein